MERNLNLKYHPGFATGEFSATFVQKRIKIAGKNAL